MYQSGNYYTVNNWQSILTRLPVSSFDVFHRFDYHKLFTRIERAECEAFAFEEDETILILPYLKRSLDEHVPHLGLKGLSDITSVYGFSGVIGSNFDEAHLSNFFQAFDNYCYKAGIVTSFIRLHPILNSSFTSSLSSVTEANRVVIVPVDDGLENITKRFKHGVRKGLRKARAKGITIRRMDKVPIDLFQSIYSETMERNGANSFYRFSDQFFEDLNMVDEIQTTYFAYLGTLPVSAEIVLHSNDYWHSFLGGTLSAYRESCANTLLKYNIIGDAANAGAKAFILGGGISPGDGIHKYKQSFNPGNDVGFNIQCNIHLDDWYEALIDAYVSRMGNKVPQSKRFQRYLQV